MKLPGRDAHGGFETALQMVGADAYLPRHFCERDGFAGVGSQVLTKFFDGRLHGVIPFCRVAGWGDELSAGQHVTKVRVLGGREYPVLAVLLGAGPKIDDGRDQ